MAVPRLKWPTTLAYLTAWFFWTAIMLIVMHRYGLSWSKAFVDSTVTSIILVLMGYVVSNTYRYYVPATRNYILRVAYVVVMALIAMTATRLSLTLIFRNDPEYQVFLYQSLPVRGLFILIMIAFMGVIFWLRFFMAEQEQNITRRNEAEQLLRDAELTRLRQQLQPHFLFNSLNSISALAGSKPEEARKMIQQLSDFLRGTLKKDETALVPLSEELHHLGLYLDIEKVRFGHRLNTDIQCQEGCAQLLLPSLILQPVVENAIKFGLYDTTGDITIRIHAHCDPGLLAISVENPYDPASPKRLTGTGFGLSAIQRRLYLLYARKDLLHTEAGDTLFRTTLHIPQLL